MKAAALPATPSLIETMRLEAGAHIPLLEGHLQRLQRSCSELGYAWPGAVEVREQLKEAVAALDTTRMWRLRLLLAADGRLSLETSPLPTLQLPLKVVVQGPRSSGSEAWLLHKTTHRPWYEEAALWLAHNPEVFDILYWNEDGQMSEGSRSNLYMRTQDGSWLTPPLQAGVLPGVQRQALLEAGLVHEAPILRDDFLAATAWRVSNALRGWCDAVLV